MPVYESLWISDIHMDRGLPHAKPTADGSTDRLEDQVALWGRLRQEAAKRGVKDIWIPGDLFNNSRPDAVTLSATARCLAELADDGLQVYLLPGNHDAVGVTGGRFTLEAFGALGREGIKYVGGNHLSPVSKGDGAIEIWPVQFMPTKEAERAITEIRAEKHDDKMNILVLHQSIVGCTHVGWTCDDGLDGDKVCEGFDAVVSGHFHDTQRFGLASQGLYLGAPMHHRFDDCHRRAGYWSIKVNTAKRTVKREFIDGGAPRFHEIDWGADVPSEIKRGDYLRYKVRATHAEWTKLRPTVEACVSEAQTSGLRASFRHDPVYHHDRRLGAKGDDMSSASLLKGEDLVVAYVDSPEVATSGLDKAELKRIGKAVLERARMET